MTDRVSVLRGRQLLSHVFSEKIPLLAINRKLCLVHFHVFYQIWSQSFVEFSQQLRTTRQHIRYDFTMFLSDLDLVYIDFCANFTHIDILRNQCNHSAVTRNYRSVTFTSLCVYEFGRSSVIVHMNKMRSTYDR